MQLISKTGLTEMTKNGYRWLPMNTCSIVCGIIYIEFQNSFVQQMSLKLLRLLHTFLQINKLTWAGILRSVTMVYYYTLSTSRATFFWPDIAESTNFSPLALICERFWHGCINTVHYFFFPITNCSGANGYYFIRFFVYFGWISSYCILKTESLKRMERIMFFTNCAIEEPLKVKAD